MIDHNIYGCNFIDVPICTVKWRKIHEDYEDEDDPRAAIVLPNRHKISRKKLLPPDKYPSHVYAGWEVDFRAQDIWNPNRVHERPWHQDLKEKDIPFDKDQKLVHSLEDLWNQHSNGEDIDSDAEYGAGLNRPIWLNEPGYRAEISALAHSEHIKRGPFDEDRIPRRVPAEDHIPTAYESLGYLGSYYESNINATQIPTQYARNYDGVEVDLEVTRNIEDEDEDPEEVDYESPDEYQLLGEEKNYFDEIAEVDFDEEAEMNDDEMKEVLAQKKAWNLPPDDAGEAEAKKESGKVRPPSRDESPTRDKKRRKLEGPKKFNQPAKPFPYKPATSYNRTVKFSNQVHSLTEQNRNLNEAISMEELESRVANHILPDIPKEKEKGFSYQVVEKNYLEAVLKPTNEEERHDFQCLVDDVYDAFEIDPKRKLMFFNALPPTVGEVEDSLVGKSVHTHQKAFYGNPDDVPAKPFEFGGEFYRLEATSISKLPPFDPLGDKEENASEPANPAGITTKQWVFAIPAPTYEEVMEEWEEIKKSRARGEAGGIFGSMKMPVASSQVCDFLPNFTGA